METMANEIKRMRERDEDDDEKSKRVYMYEAGVVQ